MNIEIQKKVERFVELSKQFSKREDELFDKVVTDSIRLSPMGYGSNIYVEDEPDKVIKTRSEVILEEAIEIATRSDDFDEYIRLQVDLSEYFKINNKLTENE